jgi:hypothetical protein
MDLAGAEIRRDLVALEPLTGRSWPEPPSGIFSTAGVAAACDLILSENGMTFVPTPRLSSLLKVPMAILINVCSLTLLHTYPVIGQRQRFEFARITMIRTWTPSMGGPVIFQIGTDGWSYRLLRRAWPVRFAPAEQMAQHYAAVTAEWERLRRVEPPTAGHPKPGA